MLWELMSGIAVISQRGHHAPIKAVAISKQNQFVLTGSVMTVKLYDMQSGELIKTYQGNGIIRSVAFYQIEFNPKDSQFFYSQTEVDDELNQMMDNLNTEINLVELNEISISNMDI